MNNLSPFKCYQRSGEILSNALSLAQQLVRPGERLLNIAEKMEDYIRSNNAIPAFPVNISINEIAAHYSPVIEDDTIIPKKSVVKVDAGVAVNGYITDAARTFIFDSKWKKLRRAAKTALNNAIKSIKPNISVYELGKIIEDTITSMRYKPVINLTGHSLAQYSLHDGVSIPNFSIPKIYQNPKDKLLIDRAYAIEPFATNGVGKVKDGPEATIFRLIKGKGVKGKLRLPKQVELYEIIRSEFKSLPFSHRWLYNKGFSEDLIIETLEEFLDHNIIHAYPILIEEKRGVVAQWEDTVYIGRKEIYILSRESENTVKLETN
ncbi:MAG: type II methionyl aminopeptidase [Candidatus Heimdallarchaeaceae archaeon]